jgi:hypothetical protein
MFPAAAPRSGRIWLSVGAVAEPDFLSHLDATWLGGLEVQIT